MGGVPPYWHPVQKICAVSPPPRIHFLCTVSLPIQFCALDTLDLSQILSKIENLASSSFQDETKLNLYPRVWHSQLSLFPEFFELFPHLPSLVCFQYSTGVKLEFTNILNNNFTGSTCCLSVLMSGPSLSSVTSSILYSISFRASLDLWRPASCSSMYTTSSPMYWLSNWVRLSTISTLRVRRMNLTATLANVGSDGGRLARKSRQILEGSQISEECE